MIKNKNIDPNAAIAASKIAAGSLSGFTLASPVLSGSVTGTYTLAGTPTITAPAISACAITGTTTIGNGCTLTTPAIAGMAVTGTSTIGNGCTLTTPAIAGATITGTVTVADGATLTTPIITSIKDTAGVVRQMHNATAKTITDGAATSLFSVALTAGNVCGGVVHFMVHATDATDHQVIAGVATYSAENKAGTIVGNLTYDSANESKSVSSGTLTLSFTDTDDTNVATFKLQPTGSLTETTYTVTYSVFPLRGAVTIL